MNVRWTTDFEIRTRRRGKTADESDRGKSFAYRHDFGRPEIKNATQHTDLAI